MSELKDFPYTPNQDKRFAVSKDQYSKERLTLLNSLRGRIQEEFGIDSGISLFGSLSKGKPLDQVSKDATDIDLSVFLNEEDLKRQLPALINREDMKRKYEVREAFVLENLRLLRESSEMGDVPREVYEEKLSKAKERIPTAIIKECVEDFVVDVLSQTGLDGNLIKDGLMVTLISDQGDYSIHSYINQLIQAYRSQDSYNILSAKINLSAFWHLDVGGGLRKYRQAFLNDLAHEPLDQAESTWRLVSESVLYFERRGVVPDRLKKQFPQTFQEACKYYGVDIAMHTKP